MEHMAWREGRQGCEVKGYGTGCVGEETLVGLWSTEKVREGYKGGQVLRGELWTRTSRRRCSVVGCEGMLKRGHVLEGDFEGGKR